MLIVLNTNITSSDLENIIGLLKSKKIENFIQRNDLSLTLLAPHAGNYFAVEVLESLPGVLKAVPISSPYKLASTESVTHRTTIEVGSECIGDGSLVFIGGPCGIESKDQIYTIARYVADAGVSLLRAGAYKPRTSPYSFQGLGYEGLELLAEVKKEFGLAVVTEAVDTESFSAVERVADMIQIGARNMQNFALLKKAGKSSKPVLLKRGPAATLEEWLFSAEYILSEGNNRLALCERGIRTWSNHSRNTLDLSIVPAAKKLTHLPILVDPSHAVGRKDSVLPCARAAVAVGCDGLLVETHCNPEEALSDGAQALLPSDFLTLVDQCKEVHRVVSQPVVLKSGF